MLPHRTLSTRAPVLPLLIGVMSGLYLASEYTAPALLLMSAALLMSLGAFYLAWFKSTSKAWLPCFMIAATLAFWAYGQIRLPLSPTASDLARPEREAQISFEIQRVMQSGERFGRPSGIAKVLTANPTSRMSKGDSLYFKLDLPDDAQLQIERGIQLQATGVLYPISRENTQESGSFESYLKGIGVHYRLERTNQILVIQSPSRFDLFCQKMNDRFQGYLRLGEPTDSDLANVYVAMLLGRKADLTDQQSERYRISGTMHFFAISGLHIGVIATVIAQFLLLIRVPHYLSPWIGLPLLYFYVEITGASPSAVRAFLMTAFFWASYSFQRQRSPFAALMASAVFVLIIRPEQLWSIGFQLSYSVVLSILLLGLPLHQALAERVQPYRWLPKASWSHHQRTIAWSIDKLTLLFAISFSAWLASAPLSASLFGFIAPGALPLNMLLVNLVALVISGGVIALACATAWLPVVAGSVNHSAWVVISAMDWMIDLSIQIPGALIRSESFPISLSYFALVLYFAALLWIHYDREKLNSPYILLPPLIILSTVATGLAISS